MRQKEPENLGRIIAAAVLAIWILAAIVIIISGCEPPRKELSRTALDHRRGETLYLIRYNTGIGYTWEPEGGMND